MSLTRSGWRRAASYGRRRPMARSDLRRTARLYARRDRLAKSADVAAESGWVTCGRVNRGAGAAESRRFPGDRVEMGAVNGSPTTSKRCAPPCWRHGRVPISRKPKRPVRWQKHRAPMRSCSPSGSRSRSCGATLYGQRSERTARLLDQLELELEEAEATASEDELAAELAAAKTTTVQAFTRARPSRKPFPDICRVSASSSRRRRPAPAAVGQAVKLGEDRHRDAGEHSAAMEGDPDRTGEIHLPGLREDHPAAGAVPVDAARLVRSSLLAMILFEKFGQHQPLNRQMRALRPRGHPGPACRPWPIWSARRSACSSRSMPCSKPMCWRPTRLHGDDTTVPVLAKGKTDHRPDLDLCARRPAVRRPRRRRRCIFTRAIAAANTREDICQLCGNPAGRRLWRIQRALPA